MATHDGRDLRPLTLAELLDRTFSLYRRHFLLFVGIMALPSIVALTWSVGMQVFRLSGLRAVTPGQQVAPGQVLAMVVPFLIAAFGLGLVYMIVYVAALGATTAAVSEVYLGREATIGSSYRRVRSRVRRLCVVSLWVALRILAGAGGVALASLLFSSVVGRQMPILAGLVMFVGIVLSFVLFVVMALRYSIAVPVATLEEVSPHQSVNRSVQLTKGYLGRLFLLVVCGTIVTYAVAMITQLPFWAAAAAAGPESGVGEMIGFAGIVIGTVGNTLVAPIPVIGLALMYYDFRVRKEGLDLELMLADLDPGAAATPAVQA